MIVSIDRLKRRKDGMIEAISGEECLCLFDEETLEHPGLTEGSQWDWEELWELSLEAQERFAKRKALNLLSRRDYSMEELCGKLEQTIDREAAERVVCRMQELGLVDDQKYAERLARDLMERKCFAPSRARRELIQKGVDRDTAQRAVERIEYYPEQSIGRIVEKKYGGVIEDEKKLRRVFSALQRYGYNAYEIWPALRPFLREGLSEDQ
nr:regulatory protein RecX [uncultured Solibaculum sp.]